MNPAARVESRFSRPGSLTEIRVIVILACHNRRDQTLACLHSLHAQRLPEGMEVQAIVVDDGSTDGTGAAVRCAFPEVTVVQGSGNLYWAAGMALAECIAVERNPDFVLWLNDDVRLDEEALAILFETAQANGAANSIVVGALRDPITGIVSYSGVRRRGAHPLRVETVNPDGEPRVVEMFHGNVVLVSRKAYLATGPIDGEFAHAHADFDYALRAAAAGIVSVLAPRTVGICADNNRVAPWLDTSIGARKRFSLLLGPKGLPPRSAARYLRRHGGPFWPMFWLAPYMRALCVPLQARAARRIGGR